MITPQPQAYPHAWKMNLRHQAAANPHLSQLFEEQMKMAIRGNNPTQPQEFIQNSRTSGIIQPAADEDRNLVDDKQVTVGLSSKRKIFLFPPFFKPTSVELSDKFDNQPDGWTNLDASAQLERETATRSHDRLTRIETFTNNVDQYPGGHLGDEPDMPQSSSGRHELPGINSDEHEAEQLSASSKAKGKQRAELELQSKDMETPLSDLFEGNAEIQVSEIAVICNTNVNWLVWFGSQPYSITI